jgi:ribonuclease-3 family protein
MEVQMSERSSHPLELGSLALAYMGDAVYELYIREKLLRGGPARVNDLHRAATDWVRADTQAKLVRRLEPLLTEPEEDILRRGRNSKSGHVPKNAKLSDYRLATGFESLLGFLFLDQQLDRLHALLDAITEEGLPS